jgi:hypothetical protein
VIGEGCRSGVTGEFLGKVGPGDLMRWVLG